MSNNNPIKLSTEDYFYLDPNKDGQITPGELSGQIEKMEERLSGLPVGDQSDGWQRQELKRLLQIREGIAGGTLRYFRGFDTDGDGRPDTNGPDFATLPMERRIKIVQADGGGNNNGVLSPGEAYESANPLGTPPLPKGPYRSMVKELPSNHPYVEVVLPGTEGRTLAFTPDLDLIVEYQMPPNRGGGQPLETHLAAQREAFIRSNFPPPDPREGSKETPDGGDFKTPPAADPRQVAAFREELEKRGWTPLRAESILRGPGPCRLDVYNRNTGKIERYVIPQSARTDPYDRERTFPGWPTIKEFLEGIREPKAYEGL